MPDASELSREVHLWYLPTTTFDDQELASRAAMVLSSQERVRAERFAFAKDQRSFLTAHWLLRSALSAYAPVPPQAWEFALRNRGKPFLTGPEDRLGLYFNLSHTPGMVACAVTMLGEVGVDVETVKCRDLMNLARRYFAPAEVSQMESLSLEDQGEAFFRFWTLKEAYIKATGSGLAMDLASFAFPNIQSDDITIEFAKDTDECPGDWHFYRHEPDPVHKIAVAVWNGSEAKPAFRIFRDIPPDETAGQFLE
jgi:4'-phosphopantetheinyl transferase